MPGYMHIDLLIYHTKVIRQRDFSLPGTASPSLSSNLLPLRPLNQAIPEAHRIKHALLSLPLYP